MKQKPVQQILEGMEEFFTEELNDSPIQDGNKSGRLFDTADLPDAPETQPDPNQVYMAYVVVRTQEQLTELLETLTLGKRYSVKEKTKTVTVNALAEVDGKTLLEQWKEKMK